MSCTTLTKCHPGKLSPYRVCLVLVCFMLTFILLHGVTGVRGTKILQPLSRFPARLGSWSLVETRSSSANVIKLLGVDDYIDYDYVDQKGNRVNLYVGFYESVGGGKGYHSPKNCLPGGGWGIDDAKEIQIVPGNRSVSPVTIGEMVIREGDDRQVVFYWYQNRGRIIASEYWEKIYLVVDALTKKRRDGSFIRIMAYAKDGNITSTELMLKKFAAEAMAELGNYLPGK